MHVSYQLAYDALGRCVARTSNGAQSSGTTYYIYDGEKPILEYDSSGTSVGVNLYGKRVDEIIQRIAIGPDKQMDLYYQQNHEGSVTLLTNASGTAIERYRYDVFGAPTIYDGNWNSRPATLYNNRFLFTGREYNASFGFYEYRARAYSPTLGRFMSEDPKGFDAGDYNLFRYCHNDPVDFTDPMGLEDVHLIPGPNHANSEIMAGDNSYNFIMALMQRQFNSAISAGMAGFSAWSAWSALSASQPYTVFAQLGRGSSHGESRSLAGKDIIATHSDFREQRDPVSATNGAEYNVYIKARHIFYERTSDGGLKSVGAGIPVRETVWMQDAAYLKKPYVLEPASQPKYTDRWGGVPDHYGATFTRAEGYATIGQTLLIPGLSATHYVTFSANGSYETEPTVATFH